MAKKTILFKSKERKHRSDVSDFLHQFGEKIETGQVLIRRGEEELVLDIPDNLILEVEIDNQEKKAKGL